MFKKILKIKNKGCRNYLPQPLFIQMLGTCRLVGLAAAIVVIASAAIAAAIATAATAATATAASAATATAAAAAYEKDDDQNDNPTASTESTTIIAHKVLPPSLFYMPVYEESIKCVHCLQRKENFTIFSHSGSILIPTLKRF